MAVKRALLFRVGTVGLTCAAYEVAIERGSEDQEGSIRPVRDCTNPTEHIVQGTGLCTDCATIYCRTTQIEVVQRIKEGGRVIE
jgi:hypothetical protein